MNIAVITPRTELLCSCHRKPVDVRENNTKYCYVTGEKCTTIRRDEIDYLVKKKNDSK